MKKLKVLILAMCCIMLCGCGNKLHIISGKVIAAGTTEEGKPYCILSTYDGKETALIITDETHIYSVEEGADMPALQERGLVDTAVWAAADKAHGERITHQGSKIPAYAAHSIDVTGYLSEDTVTLTEGAAVNIWKYYDGVIYAAQNGTELLSVRRPMGPDNTHAGGVESLDDVDEVLRTGIIEYYEERGECYDEMVELERSYSAFLKTADPENFRLRFIEQHITPSASNDEVMYFITSVMLPLDDGGESGATVYELRTGQAFDRATGEHIENFDLFTCPPDEALDHMIDIAAGSIDPAFREEMHKAFEPECIILFSDGLEVNFNRGTLPSRQNGYGLVLDFDERLLAIMQPRAVPDGWEE